MIDRDVEREEGPLAKDVIPPIPANPRPGTRSMVATTAEYGRWRLTRVELAVDEAIEEELQDYRAGAIGAAGRGLDADAYAAGEPDVAIWEGERCLALIRPLPGGEPEVLRFDAPEEGEDHRPRPTTAEERHVWGLVKHLGASRARDALVDRLRPAPREAPAGLDDDQRLLLGTLERLGRRETFDRVHLAGPYGVIAEACTRLGSDAVAELRRMIDDGRVAEGHRP